MTDIFRALCAELVKTWDATSDFDFNDFGNAAADIVNRARTALAQPEPQGVSDEDLLELMPETMRDEFSYAAKVCSDATGGQVKPGIFRVCLNRTALEYARAVLERWGRPAIKPVAVRERLPGPEDCDAKGRCWWWIVDQPGELPHWIYCTLEKLSWTNFTHSLPHYALPVPTPNNSTKQED
jgi:hypothetical protein